MQENGKEGMPRAMVPFVKGLDRSHVTQRDLHAAYQAMSADRVRESEALEWAESLVDLQAATRAGSIQLDL